MDEKTYTIKVTQNLTDLSGDNPEFLIKAGTVLKNAQDEGEYFIIDLGNESFPIMKDECEVISQ